YVILSVLYVALRHRHSVPTRRSSDLTVRSGEGERERDDRRDQAERLGHGETENQAAAHLGVGSRVAQSTLQVVAENQAHADGGRSEEHTSELQSRENLVCRLLLEKKK